MALDITTLISQGIAIYRAVSINYPNNPRNAFVYDIKFLYFTYSDVTQKLTARFNVVQSAMFEGVLKPNIDYDFDSIAEISTIVDKFGNVVDADSADAWGTEFDRISILFNAPIADSAIVAEYQQELFDKGVFDRPKR